MVEITPVTREADRLMTLCNACRYCEGYCAVFPAMELRRFFTTDDLDYLANLCHNCRGCYYACQYAPPHEFAINLPQTFGLLRQETYEQHAWPAPMAARFRRSAVVTSLAAAFGITLVLIAAAPSGLWETRTGPGAFYSVIPMPAMVGVSGAVLLFSITALLIAAARFWRSMGHAPALSFPTVLKALRDTLTLKNLGGGGDGCNDTSEAFSNQRRRFHHLLFYGFVLCFASTTAAAIWEHILHRLAPYPLLSLPVLLGTTGGAGMVIGTAGLLWLKFSEDQQPTAPATRSAGYALLLQLLLTAVTGLALLILRNTPAMGVLLAIHLGVILSFFMTLPWTHFVHGAFRFAALLRNAAEQSEKASK